MSRGFPHTVTHGKSLPLDVVLYLMPSASAMRVKYLFYFIFGFSLDQIRWQLGIVGSIMPFPCMVLGDLHETLDESSIVMGVLICM